MGRFSRVAVAVAIGLLSVSAPWAALAQGVALPYPAAYVEPPTLLPPPPEPAPPLLPAPSVPPPSIEAAPIVPVAPTPGVAPLPAESVPQPAAPPAVSPYPVTPYPATPYPTTSSPAAAPIAPAVESAPASEATHEVVVTPAAEPPVAWYRPRRWFGPTPWDTGFELGLNGSSGTSDTLSLRTGGYFKRKSDHTKTDFSLYYNSTNADGAQTQSNALLDTRVDWLQGDSPWSLFVMSQTFYDEFQAFDLNVNVTTGVGYQLLEEEWVETQLSFGAGASREFGGPDDEWVPEAQFGLDHEQKISDSQRFYAKVDYFPEFTDFSEFRVLAELGLEIDLSRPSNTSLKLSLTDRFDSSPDGVPAHNTNYSVLLLWKR